MKKQEAIKKTREELFAEKASNVTLKHVHCAHIVFAGSCVRLHQKTAAWPLV